GEGLVPDRRQAQYVPRIAGAQRADDDVVALGRVLDCAEVIADALGAGQGRDGPGAVREQRLLEGGIAPRLGDDARADMRADAGLVGLDDAVERRALDIALLDQDGFE